MTRREALRALLGAAVGALSCRSALRLPLQAAQGTTGSTGAPDGAAAPERIDRIELSDAEWRAILDPPGYAVLRREATELSGSSALNREKRAGTFVCAGCFLPLFRSEEKYESGTGWPSFFDTLPGRVGTRRDFRLLAPRTEYHCIRCEGHQGHVFDDGPQPTGLRYCNNGVALRFVPEGDELPSLRQRASR